MLLILRVIYDPSVWTEFGYTVQRYIGSAASVGIRVFAVVFGISLVVKVIYSISGSK